MTSPVHKTLSSHSLSESVIPSPVSLATKRQWEIFGHLCLHDGPDMEGHAHPTCKTVQLADLVPALEAVQSIGRAFGLQPYHFYRVKGVWNDAGYRDEIIVKKINHLLRDKFDGDLLKLCRNIQARDLLGPLREVIGDWEYCFSVAQPIGTYFHSSPYRILARYLELTGARHRFLELRPYHFSCASQGTYRNPAFALEVLCKKINALLESQYQGDLARLCCSTTRVELLAPFEDRVGTAGTVTVKMGEVFHAYHDCLYAMMRAYIMAQGKEDQFRNFRPYHMATASQATYQNRLYLREVLVKSCKYQIAHRYEGDEARFLERVTAPQLEEPFVESIAGHPMQVCARTAVVYVGSSSNRIKRIYKRYRSAISLADEEAPKNNG